MSKKQRENEINAIVRRRQRGNELERKIPTVESVPMAEALVEPFSTPVIRNPVPDYLNPAVPIFF